MDINEVENFNMDEYLHWRNVRATILSYRDIAYFDVDRRRKRLKRYIISIHHYLFILIIIIKYSLVDKKPTYVAILSPDILNGKYQLVTIIILLLLLSLLSGKHFRLIEDAIDKNQDFFDCLIDFHDDSGFAPVNPNNSNNNDSDDDSNVNYANGQHRNLAILHSFYREWSSEGN
jgi:hypothetical protein